MTLGAMGASRRLAALAVLATAALTPALTATAQHTAIRADSVWGITAPTPADPAPAATTPPSEAPATPDDSVWG